MKILTLTALLFITLTSSHAGWRDVLLSNPVESLKSLPEIKVKPEKEFAVVTVKNTGATPLSYAGYAEGAPQVFIEELKDGVWTDTTWDWCGTGMQSHVILPGKVVEFKLVRREKPQRVYTFFSEKGEKKQNLVLLWESK